MWLDEYHRNGGEYVKPKQCEHYEMVHNVKNTGILYASLQYPLANAPPIKGAVDAILKLRKAGNHVVFLTAAPSLHCVRANELKLNWLRQVFGAPQDDFYISCPAHLKKYVYGDVLIEDNAQTIQEWKQRHTGDAILFKAPYAPTGVEWNAILELLLSDPVCPNFI